MTEHENQAAEALPEPLPDVNPPSEPIPDVADPEFEDMPGVPAVEAAEPTESSDSETEVPPVEVEAQNVTHDYAIFSEGSKGSPDKISLPMASEKVLTQRIDALPNVDMTQGEKQQKWAWVLRDSLSKLMVSNVFGDRLLEPTADFRQNFEFNNTKFRGQMPKIDQSSGEKTVEGETALIQLLSHMGAGGVFHAPLFNSGFWVAFKPAGEDDLLELNRQIAVDKVLLGRETYGLAYSNNLVYTVDRIFEFALRHVYYTTVKKEELPIDKLRDYIKTQDIFPFIWGFLCSNYPNGFHYEAACINNPAKCTHVISGTCDLTKMLHPDNALLNDWQKSHMATMRPHSRSLDQVKQYQDQMTRSAPYSFLINEGGAHEVRVTLKSPSVAEYIEQGHGWVSEIVDSVHRSLGMDAPLDDRNHQQNMMAKAATLCEYAHWIQELEFGQLTPREGVESGYRRKIEDLSTIKKALARLSSNDVLRERIMEEVRKYINHSTVSVVGYETFDCPVCGVTNTGSHTYPRHVNIIPIDIIQVFFALLTQRLRRIAAR